jgi:hypothetical protein
VCSRIDGRGGFVSSCPGEIGLIPLFRNEKVCSIQPVISRLSVGRTSDASEGEFFLQVNNDIAGLSRHGWLRRECAHKMVGLPAITSNPGRSNQN